MRRKSKDQPNDLLISRLRKIDWDFSGEQSDSLFSALHWHPARFASQLPATLIGLLSNPGEVVLDPFVGSGSTIVESQRLGRISIGIDLNPVAILMAKAKTLTLTAHDIEVLTGRLVEDARLRLRMEFHELSSHHPIYPQRVQAQKWYTARVFRDLCLLWGLLGSYTGEKRILAEAAFSSILLPVCRETRHWGYVCDNSAPKSDYERDVLATYSRTLNIFLLAYRERDAELEVRFGRKKDVLSSAHCLLGDANLLLEDLAGGSVDLVVTSPPYFGVCDYIKAQRLSLEWFGVDIEPLRRSEIGARSKRHRKAAAIEYLAELESVLLKVRRILKPGGCMVLIIGQSRSRESVLDDLKVVLRGCGFDIKCDMNRRVSSQRRQAPSIVGEHLFVLN